MVSLISLPPLNKRGPITNPNASQSRRRVQQRRSNQARLTDDVFPAKNKPVIGQVRILKRGESLRSGLITIKEENNSSDLVLGCTDRLGPEPETVEKQIWIRNNDKAAFAGSGFFVSPPPSSVPVPDFLKKKNQAVPVPA